jgi:hypothetical protein
VWKDWRLRLALAAILRERGAMSRSQPVRLREAPGGPAPDARVIDAKFTEVGRKRRGVLGRVWIALVALFWAAVIGFLIPPAWIVMQEIGAYFAGR